MKQSKTKLAAKGKTSGSKETKTKSTPKVRRKRTVDPLATCPIDGAGWCPYPFSVAQLKKRLAEKARQKASQA